MSRIADLKAMVAKGGAHNGFELADDILTDPGERGEMNDLCAFIDGVDDPRYPGLRELLIKEGLTPEQIDELLGLDQE